MKKLVLVFLVVFFGSISGVFAQITDVRIIATGPINYQVNVSYDQSGDICTVLAHDVDMGPIIDVWYTIDLSFGETWITLPPGVGNVDLYIYCGGISYYVYLADTGPDLGFIIHFVNTFNGTQPVTATEFVEFGNCNFGIGLGIFWPETETDALALYSSLDETDQAIFILGAESIAAAHAVTTETNQNQLISNGEWYDVDTGIEIEAYMLTTGELQVVVFDPRNVEAGMTKQMTCIRNQDGEVYRLEDRNVPIG